MILAFDFACAKVAWFGSTFFSHICSIFLKSFLTRLIIHGKSSKHGSTRDNIAQGNFVEHSPSVLHAPQIWHECQQDYFSQRYLTQNHFEQCFEWSAHQHTWPLLSATATAQAFSSATNMKGFQLHTFLYNLLQYLDCHLPLPTAHIFQYYNTPRDHIPQGRVVEHCPSLLHAQIFAYKG